MNNLFKPYDRLHFLFGMVAWFLFLTLWQALSPMLHMLDYVMSPYISYAITAVIEISLFLLLFHKARFMEIKWSQFIVMLVVLLALAFGVHMLQLYLENAVREGRIDGPYSHFDEKGRLTYFNIRGFVSYGIWVLMIGYVWFQYALYRKDWISELEVDEQRGFYAGILFVVIFGLLRSIIQSVAQKIQIFVSNSIVWDVVFCVLLLLITLAFVLMVVKGMGLTRFLPLIIVLLVIDFFCKFFLQVLLFNHFESFASYENRTALSLIWYVGPTCYLLLFIVTFVAYRKELKKSGVVNEMPS